MSKDRSPQQYASVGIRIVAGLWDWLVALLWGIPGGVVLTAGYYFGWFLLYPDTYVDDTSIAIGIAITVLLIFPAFTLFVTTLVHFSYGIWLYRRHGTPAHRLDWLLIVTTDGEQVPKRRALLRYVIGTPFFLLPYLLIALILLGDDISNWLGSYPFLDFIASFNRTEGYFVLVLVAIPLLVVVNHVWMTIDRKNRGLNDVIAGTVVLYALPVATKTSENNTAVRFFFRGREE